MKVNVVIPTYNRSSRIIQTLLSLNNQTYRDFNVFVIDDGSEDNTEELIRNNMRLLNYPFFYTKQKNGGASNARNNIIRQIKDGLIILFDDDIIPGEDVIKMHVKFHQNHSSSILSGTAEMDINKASNDIERYKVFMEQEWNKFLNNEPMPFRVTFNKFIVTTANTSFTKDTFLEIGEFDERLKDGYDFEFGIRALLKNIPVYFDINIKTVHNDFFTLSYYAQRQRAYIKSKLQIFNQNPEYKKYLPSYYYTLRIPLYKKIIYKLISKTGLAKYIDRKGGLFVLPKRLRYKLYGLVIASLTFNENEV